MRLVEPSGLEPEAMKAYAALLRRHVARVQQASAQLWAAASGKPMETGAADARDYLVQLQQSLGEIGNVAEVLEVEGEAGAGGDQESGTRHTMRSARHAG